MKSKVQNRAEKQIEAISAELEKDGLKVGGGTIGMSFHDQGQAQRGYQLEKRYQPSPEAKKKPVTDALTWLLRLRGFKVAWALLKRAESGNVDAIRELCDRVEGKVAQQMELSGTVNIAALVCEARARARSFGQSLPSSSESDNPRNRPPRTR